MIFMNVLKNTLLLITRTAKFFLKLGTAKLIIASGMPRSGSTLLYNITRLCLEEKYKSSIHAGYINEFSHFPKASVYLLKTHNVSLFLRLRASMIFYSYRDIRDALVSSQRKFNKEPSIELCRSWIEEYKIAKKHATSLFKYEDFTKNVEEAIFIISKNIGVEIDAREILKKTPKVWLDKRNNLYHDKKTLLHGGHSTGTKRGAWKTNLSQEMQEEIIQEFAWWLHENNYD